jgi:exodeoxyribonuclease V alpha subunit
MSTKPEAMTQEAFRRAASPFEAAGLLEPSDVAIVSELGRLAGERRPEVLVALALALSAPRRGDVALDLDKLGALVALGEEAVPGVFEAPRALPAALATSPLVGGADKGLIHPFVLHRGLVYSRRYFVHQTRLAAALIARASGLAELAGASGPAVRATLDRLFPEDEGGAPGRQRLAVAVALRKRLTVISGGPGTGKTFTIRTLLAALLELSEEGGVHPRVALAAPTGKAAARITEALREGLDALPTRASVRAELAALEGQTIHRLLAVDPFRSGRFRHGPRRPLPHDVVIVDEASMVDLPLFTKLVSALRREARLVLLGDRNQLASVEAGAVLADLTATRIPFEPRFSPPLAAELVALGSLGARPDATTTPLEDCVVHLERPRRFDHAGGVGQLALAIAGASPEALDRAVALLAGDGAAGPGERDLALIPHGAAHGLSAKAIARLASGFRPYLASLEAGPRRGEEEAAFHRRVLDAFHAYRVLCVHRVGPYGAERLERELARALLRDRRAMSDPDGLWVGRPVLVTRNSYEVGRMNGDVGLVLRRSDGAKVIAFADDAGPGVAYLRAERLPPHEGALAMTVHKSQGSQFDSVALVLPDASSPLLTREIVYTAITRARLGATVYGDREVLRLALERAGGRASGLAEMLWNPPDPGAPT